MQQITKRMVFLLALLLVFTLTACSTEPISNKTSSSSAEDSLSEESSDIGSKEDGKITIMSVDTTLENWQAYIEQAEEKTGLDIETVATPTNTDDRHAKITTMLSSGDTSVDIFTVNGEMIVPFKSAGFLQPLQDTVMTSTVAAAFPQDYLATECTQDGDIIAVPMYIDILHFWIDQRVLDEVGMESPTTKEEFLEFVSKATNGSERYGYGGAWEKTYVFNEIATFVGLFGGDYYDWTNEKTVAGVKFLHDLAADGYTPLAQMADIYEPMMQKMIDGTYASMFMYTGGFNIMKDSGEWEDDKIHIVPPPSFDGNDPVALLSCWNWVVGKSSENKEAAYKFLQYAASEEGQTDYAQMSNRICANMNVINDPNFVADGIEETRYYMENVKLLARPIVPQATEFISEMGSLFQQYMSDEITLEEFCAAAQKSCDTYHK